MLVLKMELWPSGDETKAQLVAQANIANDGTGGDSVGNYNVVLFNGRRMWKKGRVENFPRKKRIGWDLICCALYSMLAGRNGLPT